MSAENCIACPVVCSLRDKAREVLAELPLTEVASDFTERQYRDALAREESHGLLQAEESVIRDVIGLPGLTDYSAESHVAALDDVIKTGELYGTDQYQNGLLRKHGEKWATAALELADGLEAHCDSGLRHGLRVPLVDVVVPTPEQIGADYCGSHPGMRDSADVHLLRGTIGVY
jgi:hypothetical protein